MTPARAIDAGADYLVVGRPIVEARDPKAAADAIVAEIERSARKAAQGERRMAKGYWIANVDVRNDDGYKPYVAAVARYFRKFGGRFVTRGGKFEVAGGQRTAPAVVGD